MVERDAIYQKKINKDYQKNIKKVIVMQKNQNKKFF